tara:strand:+ start:11902 stop:12783 length:882 start_codon:yes stop_codon:yes gene_type:complete
MDPKKTAKISICCLFRGGSNHLAANLHYQDHFFSHSERKGFGNIARHDVFGNYRADEQFDEDRYDKAKYHVWKRFWTRTGNSHYRDRTAQNQNKIIVFQVRHPYMVYKSMLRYIDKATEEGKRPANPWKDVDGFKNENLTDMIGIYEKLFKAIGICKLTGQEFHVFYHEQYLKEGASYLTKLIKNMNLEDGSEICRNIKSHKEYLDNLNSTKELDIKQLKPGYGNYEPWRSVDHKTEIDKIKECPEPIIEKICTQVVDSIREQTNPDKIEKALALTEKELAEFKEFYTKTIFE